MSNSTSLGEFIRHNPYCIFCGGTEPTTTKEHCPPKALFQNRQWPEGYEFPACIKCNNGTSNYDRMLAMLARTDFSGDAGNRDGKFPSLVAGVHAQDAMQIRSMFPSVREARTYNRRLGITPKHGQTHQQASPLKITSEMQTAVAVFSRKLAKALYFREVGTIFPSHGGLGLRWFTNADLLEKGHYEVFEMLEGLPGHAPTLKRGGKELNDQFSYKMTVCADVDMFVLQASFGSAFGLVIFGSGESGRLEGIMMKLAAKHNGFPFTLL
ncbi:hypothetical protein HH213_07160 [Duganella dendranthematis]|jgi:hypothetical protein|uniref:HNH endonuclease n=1 Tax=Duganella dendranthematis TaxID=2728021 RepID=A0ABX6MAQ7_9BURK|nr:hypothetical protein [Duganella dendranthematis]QJD89897.1 hypothetical protein HH213_07160 [Duganella dendranthematis]